MTLSKYSNITVRCTLKYIGKFTNIEEPRLGARG